MNSLAEEVCWAWLRVQTELNKPIPDEEILEILKDLHRESFEQWATSANIKMPKYSNRFVDILRAEEDSFKLRKKQGKLNSFEKCLDWLERVSKFSLYVVTFGVLGSRWK